MILSWILCQTIIIPFSACIPNPPLPHIASLFYQPRSSLFPHHSFGPVSIYSQCPLTHLHVSLQLHQMKAVPCDEAGALMGEVHAPEAGLAWPQVRLTYRVVMSPYVVIVDGDVLKLGGVSVGPEHLLVSNEDTQTFVQNGSRACAYSFDS